MNNLQYGTGLIIFHGLGPPVLSKVEKKYKVSCVSKGWRMSVREIVPQCMRCLLWVDTEKYCHSKLGLMMLFLLFASWVTTSSTDTDPSTTCLGPLLTASSLSLHPDILCISLSWFWAHCHIAIWLWEDRIWNCVICSYSVCLYCFPGSSCEGKLFHKHLPVDDCLYWKLAPWFP